MRFTKQQVRKMCFETKMEEVKKRESDFKFAFYVGLTIGTLLTMVAAIMCAGIFMLIR